jgi:hypothetical protein
MPQANSDNNGTNGALDSFFSVFNPNSAAYKNVNILINNVFCIDDNTQNPPIPYVGIAQHGPQFIGALAINALFVQLTTTFPDIWWAESTTHPQITAVPRLYSNDGYNPPTVGVQTTLWGTHTQQWFQGAGFSLPLSAILPNKHPTNVPSFAVFTFGAADPTRVSRLSFYMDRYNQMREVQPEKPAKFDQDIIKFLQGLQAQVESQRFIKELDLANEAKRRR